MSDDNRTHQPTPRRRKEFRDRGEIAGSRELTAAATFAAAAIALVAAGPAAWRSLHAVTAAALGGDGRAAVLVHARTAFTVAVAPILVVGAAAALLAAMAQRGWPPVVRWPGFELSRVFGFSGLAGAWSPKAALARLGGAAAKTAAIAAALALVLARHLTAVATAADADAIAATARAAVLELAAVAIAVMLAVAAFDYLRARRALGKKMMMTPDEIRREHREQDGDPAVKARRRARMRELARRRVVAEAKRADVILVNPTHYAVALRYRAEDGGAPRVTAKGTDELAGRIREAARAAGVPVVSRPPLARALWKLVPEGREVPSALYHAVAEVLAYVYRLRRRAAGRPS